MGNKKSLCFHFVAESVSPHFDMLVSASLRCISRLCLFGLFFMTCGCTLLEEDESKPDQEVDSRPIAPRTLLIGSSFGMNTISQLPWIFARSGYKVDYIGNVYVGAFTLQDLAHRIEDKQSLPYKEFKEEENAGWTPRAFSLQMSSLLDKEWDVICLQRSAYDDETWTTEQSTAFGFILEYIFDYCKNNGLQKPRILFNSGFADADSDQDNKLKHTSAIIKSAKMMKEEFGIEIVPTAMALANARITYLKNIGANTHLCYDSQHLDYGIGCWVASACLFESIMRPLGESIEACYGYGSQIEQLNLSSFSTSKNYTEPTIKTMAVAKSCVLSAFVDDEHLDLSLESKYQNEDSP